MYVHGHVRILIGAGLNGELLEYEGITDSLSLPLPLSVSLSQTLCICIAVFSAGQTPYASDKKPTPIPINLLLEERECEIQKRERHDRHVFSLTYNLISYPYSDAPAPLCAPLLCQSLIAWTVSSLCTVYRELCFALFTVTSFVLWSVL